jgi:hypothetical protein
VPWNIPSLMPPNHHPALHINCTDTPCHHLWAVNMDLLEKARPKRSQKWRGRFLGAAMLPPSPNVLIFGGRAPLGLLSWPRGCTHGVEVFLCGFGLDFLSSGT